MIKRSDCFSALFFLFVSLFVCQQSLEIEVGTLGQPGPGLLPFGVGVGIGLLALRRLLYATFSKERGDEVGESEHTFRKGRLFLVCLLLFSYTIAVKPFGFFLSTFVFVILMLRLIESGRWWRTVVSAVLITCGNYLLFEVWLRVGLPKGFWGW
jgi:putative tricarboxylic transport membrane protein